MDDFAVLAGTHKSTLYTWRKGTEVTSIKANEVLKRLGFSERERITIKLKMMDSAYERAEPAWSRQELEDMVKEKDAEIARLKAQIKRLKHTFDTPPH